MRGSEEMPGNPWPHGMVISVEQGDDGLLRLLFVREAWGLDSGGVPQVAGPVEVGGSALPAGVDRGDASVRWLSEWRKTWERFDARDRRVRPPDAETQALLDATPDEELSAVFIGRPSRFWDAGIDLDAYSAWQRIQTSRHEPWSDNPERLSVTALVAAWRSGLTHIVQLPYEGYFAERINSQYLVVSEHTRYDRALFDRALATPVR